MSSCEGLRPQQSLNWFPNLLLAGRASTYPSTVTLLVRFWLALVGLFPLVGACYDGDHLGFVPCEAAADCDAPPRAQPRRDCLQPVASSGASGYCALPCVASTDCVSETPGTAADDAACDREVGADSGHCVLACSLSQPCPTGMECLGYASAQCTDNGLCVCFPSKPG